MRHPLYALALLLIAAAALGLRLPNLAQRPLHNDEGVNTVKFNDLWEGKFHYDPNEYHGPTLYYLTLPVAWASGAKTFAETTEVTYRLVPVLFGVGLILLLPLVSDGLGRGGVLWAALFTAVSPAFVFYSRYYIHEMPLIFFAFAAIACGWRYRRSKRMAWAALCGAFVGLTYATKETWVLALAAAAASAVTAATIWHIILKGPGHRLHFRSRALLVGGVAFAVVFVLLFSGFFTTPRGPWDAITAYFHYTKRASGSIHDHPWHYYLSTLLYSQIRPQLGSSSAKGGPIWTEAAIVLLAVVGFVVAVLRRVHPHHTPGHPDHVPFSAYPPFVRFIGFYTLFLTVGFSIIPYKTPWCMLGFFHGMVLLAGFACGQIVHAMPNLATKALATVVLLAAAGQLAWQADRATNNFADPKHRNYFAVSRYNPYVYAHTGSDIFTGIRQLEEIASVSPLGRQLSIDVVTPDCWPMPFYLRTFGNVGYPVRPEDRRDADVIIGTEADAKEGYGCLNFGLRPTVVLQIYVRPTLWDRLRAKWSAGSKSGR